MSTQGQHGAQGRTSRPEFSRVYPRSRLFELFDSAREHPLLWIAAPAGAGKTVAISSYLAARDLSALWYLVDPRDEDPAHFFLSLAGAAQALLPGDDKSLPLLTPEYLPYLEVFSRNFFEALFHRLPLPFALVLDNYQDVTGAFLHGALRSAAELMPAGANVFAISREEPPAPFARLRAHGGLSVIGWDQFRLNLAEAQSLADLRRGERVLPEFVAHCHDRSRGWTAGLVLLLDHGPNTTGDGGNQGGPGTQLLFDYFAEEIFSRLPADAQTLLPQIALLPYVTPTLAERLTGSGEAADILAGLHRQSFFIARQSNVETTYAFHPLFREFLLARIQKQMGNAELTTLRARAAEILRDVGRPEDAVPFYLALHDWPALAETVLLLAPELLMQGRHQTLVGWLQAVPETAIQEDAWLLFYLGNALLPSDPATARRLFEQAYERFDVRDDGTGLYVSWCAVIDAYVLERGDFSLLSHWVDAYAGIRDRHPQFPTPQVEVRIHTMLLALLHARPQHPELPAWAESGRRLLGSQSDCRQGALLACGLLHYYSWSADLTVCESVIDLVLTRHADVKSDPFAGLMFDTYRGLQLFLVGNGPECLHHVRSVLEHADSYGMHFHDFLLHSLAVFSYLLMGDLAGARESLDLAGKTMNRGRYLEISHYHLVEGLFKAQSDEWAQALESFTLAITFARQAGTLFPEAIGRSALTKALFRLGREREAEAELVAVLKLAGEIRSTHLECLMLLTEAETCLANGNRKRGLAALAEGLALSRHCGGLVAGGWWGPDWNARLYAAALDANIEVPYVRGLIRRLGLLPPDPLLAPEAWPWPIRIHTLGRYEILLNDEVLRWNGKAQRKPLDLLKALIAYGGISVPETRLCEAVWPDADGDAAHRDFASALYRLRRLIGTEKALRTENACLSLDRNLVWLDIWALDARLSSASDYQSEGPFASALALYRGEFLPEESATWVLAPRERVRSRLRRAVESHGQTLEASGKGSEAADAYLQLLEVDPVAESIYARLMQCYERQGYLGEALAVYERCRLTLSSHLGIQPGPELQGIKARLQDAAKAHTFDSPQKKT